MGLTIGILSSDEEMRISTCERGIMIFGNPKLDEMDLIAAMAERRGLDRMDLGLAHALGATFVLTTKETGAAWREEVTATLAGDHPPLEALIRGVDTGRSSATLAALLIRGDDPPELRLSSDGLRVLSRLRGGLDSWPTPGDADDLGRCVRLLRMFPALREHMDPEKISVEAWKPLFVAWPILESMYAKAEAGVDPADLNEALRALNGAIKTPSGLSPVPPRDRDAMIEFGGVEIRAGDLYDALLKECLVAGVGVPPESP